MRRSGGQLSQAYSVFFDYDYASCIKGRGESWQVEVQELQLLRRLIWSPSKKDDGGLRSPAQRQNAGKVGIGGNNCSVFRSGAVEDRGVRRRLQAVLANVNGVVTGLAQSPCDQRG